MKILKFIPIVLVVFCSIQSSAFKEKVKGNGKLISEIRTTVAYDQISANGSFNIELTSGTEGKLTIEIEENLSKYLITEVEGEELKISWKKGINISTRKSVKIIVPVAQISTLSLSGSGKISSSTVIKADELNLNLSGSGRIDIDIESSSIVSNLSGSGSIGLAGETENFECSVSGSGRIGGYDLIISNMADAKVSGSGNVKVTVNGTLNAKVSGSGNFRYKGNPTKEIIKVSGSGNVSNY